MLFTLLVATLLLQAAASDRVTVPLLVEGPHIDLTFRRADGSTRTAGYLVNPAGGGFSLVDKLARDIGVRWGKTVQVHEDTEVGIVTTLSSR